MRPHDEPKQLAIVRTMAIHTFARSWAIERNDSRKSATRDFLKVEKSDAAIAAPARGSTRSAAPCAPAPKTLPPCSPSRSSPAGARGNLDRGARGGSDQAWAGTEGWPTGPTEGSDRPTYSRRSRSLDRPNCTSPRPSTVLVSARSICLFPINFFDQPLGLPR